MVGARAFCQSAQQKLKILQVSRTVYSTPAFAATRSMSHTHAYSCQHTREKARPAEDSVIRANGGTGPGSAQVQRKRLTASENTLNASATPHNYLMEAITYPAGLGMTAGEKGKVLFYFRGLCHYCPLGRRRTSGGGQSEQVRPQGGGNQSA